MLDNNGMRPEAERSMAGLKFHLPSIRSALSISGDVPSGRLLSAQFEYGDHLVVFVQSFLDEPEAGVKTARRLVFRFVAD